MSRDAGLERAAYRRMPEVTSSYMEVCERAARAGGEVLLAWQDRFQAREKAPRDLVTEADVASQEKSRSIV